MSNYKNSNGGSVKKPASPIHAALQAETEFFLNKQSETLSLTINLREINSKHIAARVTEQLKLQFPNIQCTSKENVITVKGNDTLFAYAWLKTKYPEKDSTSPIDIEYWDLNERLTALTAKLNDDTNSTGYAAEVKSKKGNQRNR